MDHRVRYPSIHGLIEKKDTQGKAQKTSRSRPGRPRILVRNGVQRATLGRAAVVHGLCKGSVLKLLESSKKHNL